MSGLRQFNQFIEKSVSGSFVLCPVLVPEVTDHQGEVVSADEIEEAAHAYMLDSQAGSYMHREIIDGIHLVESFIVRADSTINGVAIKSGTWIVGWKIDNPELREQIRAGKITGMSIGGSAEKYPEVF